MPITNKNIPMIIVILFLILSVFVIYLHSSKLSSQTSESNATSTRSNTVLSDAEKSKILNQLSEGITTTVSTKDKLQTLNTLQKQKSTSTLTDSDKLKLLESLK